MNRKVLIMDLRSNFQPKQPSPRTPNIDAESYQQGHSDGWNACMSYLKAVGKI